MIRAPWSSKHRWTLVLSRTSQPELLINKNWGTIVILLRESLIIAGWVAMCRPMQIFLYEWWPLRNTRRLGEKLSRVPVEVRKREA